jgi:CDP-diacylglycerol--serine O-phosphatidyltransferase
VCAALRLARFNIEISEDDDHMHFSGLPSPAAAATIASFAIMFYTLRRDYSVLPYADEIDTALQAILPFFGLAVALLMVSRVPYPHVVNQFFRGHRNFNHVVSIVIGLVVVMLIRGYSVPIICCAFVLAGPARYLWKQVIQPRLHKEAA